MSDPIEYLPLPDSYVSHSLTFRLIKREGDAAMFGAWQDGKPPREWEVFIVQRHEGFTLRGKTYPPAEKVPKSEEWGTYAWTCCSQEAADFRFSHALREAKRRIQARQG